MTLSREESLARIGIILAMTEFKKNTDLRRPIASPHEGWAEIQEKMDLLWIEVKNRSAGKNKKALLNASKQLTAMSLRFMVDVCLAPEKADISDE